MRERETEVQEDELTPYHLPEVYGKRSMHPVPNGWGCLCHTMNSSICAKAVWGMFWFTFQHVACLLGLSQILKYSKIIHKFLWEFFQYHCKEVEYYFLEQRWCSSKDLIFPSFFIVILLTKMKQKGFESTRSKRKTCYLQYFRIYIPYYTFSSPPYSIYNIRKGQKEKAAWITKSNPLQLIT